MPQQTNMMNNNQNTQYNQMNNCNQPSTSYDPTATSRIIESQRKLEKTQKLQQLLKCFTPFSPGNSLYPSTNCQCESCCKEALAFDQNAMNCCIEKCIVDSSADSKYSLFCINYKFNFNSISISIPEIK